MSFSKCRVFVIVYIRKSGISAILKMAQRENSRLETAKIMNHLAQVRAMKRELIRCCSEFYPMEVVVRIQKALELASTDKMPEELESAVKLQEDQKIKFKERCKGVVDGYDALKERRDSTSRSQAGTPILGPYTQNVHTTPPQESKTTNSSTQGQKGDKGKGCIIV